MIGPSTPFNRSVSADGGSEATVYTPFSFRLTGAERAFLERHSGHLSWAAYIREQVFGDQATKRRTLRKPSVDEQQLVLVLSALGESRLASNLNQLAKHANMGTLNVNEQLEQELVDACAAVYAMRDILLKALGQKI